MFAAPFNPLGFQMCPSREACEATLQDLAGSTVIGFSVLAAGYLGLDEAVRYVAGLRGLAGVAVGASTIEHACQTFGRFSRAYRRQTLDAVRDVAT